MISRNFDQDIAHIVYASDDKFAEILGVSLASLYENSKDLQDIVVYVLDSGISEVNKQNLIELSRKYSRHEIVFISAKNINKELSMDVRTDRGSLSQYARLFISRDLACDLGRVLYLDCDIIVNSSISQLWRLDMHGKTIAALKDAFSKYYRKNIDLKPRDVMFNSGVMLIDLNLWEKNKIEKKLMTFIKAHNGDIQQGDQGALNAVLSEDIYCFHPKFNSVTIFYDFSYKEMLVYRKPVDFYSESEIKEAVENPVIIHYTTSFMSVRPWIEGCTHRYVDKWLENKKLTPWSKNELWKNNKPEGIKGLYVKLSQKLPRNVSIALSGILQAYGRPFLNRIK